MDENQGTTAAIAQSALPGEVLTNILIEGIKDTLASLYKDDETISVEFATPDHIVGQCFDNRVRILAPNGHAWFDAIISLRAAEAVAALLGLTEQSISEAKGPITIRIAVSDGSAVLKALARLDGRDGSLFPGFHF